MTRDERIILTAMGIAIMVVSLAIYAVFKGWI
jgi:hypothetical protein